MDSMDRMDWDSNGDEGFLVAPNGERVQGLQWDLITFGDIRIYFDPAWMPVQSTDPNATVAGFQIDADGMIRGRLSDGTIFPLGQIFLRMLSSPEAGLKFRFGLILDRGELGAAAQMSAPGAYGLGLLSIGTLETPQPQITIRGKVGSRPRWKQR